MKVVFDYTFFVWYEREDRTAITKLTKHQELGFLPTNGMQISDESICSKVTSGVTYDMTTSTVHVSLGGCNESESSWPERLAECLAAGWKQVSR